MVLTSPGAVRFRVKNPRERDRALLRKGYGREIRRPAGRGGRGGGRTRSPRPPHCANLQARAAPPAALRPLPPHSARSRPGPIGAAGGRCAERQPWTAGARTPRLRLARGVPPAPSSSPPLPLLPHPPRPLHPALPALGSPALPAPGPRSLAPPSAPAGLPHAHPEPAARRQPSGHVRMEIRQHEWLSASPHEGFEQMRLKSRPKEPSPSLTRVGANFYSSVKQQDYSASVWLRRKDKLEHVSAARSPGRGPAPAARAPQPRSRERGPRRLPRSELGRPSPPPARSLSSTFLPREGLGCGEGRGGDVLFRHCLSLHTSTSPGCQCGEGGGRHSQCVPGVPVRGEQDGELTQCGSREPA